jgi:hypothetical protein
LTQQSKKGRPRSKKPMVHTAIVLPTELLERIRRNAEESGLGLSAKIRELLLQKGSSPGELTLFEMSGDPETNQLLHAIRELSESLARDMGTKWHEHPYALAAFKAGVEAFLAQHQSEGDASVRPDTRVVGEAHDPPEVVGRTHARLIWRARGEREDTPPDERKD